MARFCPKCGGKSTVLDSRPEKSESRGERTRRRRICDYCEFRYTTAEVAVSATPDVVTANLLRIRASNMTATLDRLSLELTDLQRLIKSIV